MVSIVLHRYVKYNCSSVSSSRDGGRATLGKSRMVICVDDEVTDVEEYSKELSRLLIYNIDGNDDDNDKIC